MPGPILQIASLNLAPSDTDELRWQCARAISGRKSLSLMFIPSVNHDSQRGYVCVCVCVCEYVYVFVGNSNHLTNFRNKA